MKWIAMLLLGGMAWAQRCPEPLYVVTSAELRWTAGNTIQTIAAGKTAATCEGDTLEALKDAQISFGYAAGQPQRRQLKAGEKVLLSLPKGAPPVLKGLGATLSENIKNAAQRWLGGGSARPVDAASRTAEIAQRSIYMPLLALGNNRLLAGRKHLVLPYAEASPPYTLTLSSGSTVLAQGRSEAYTQAFVLELAQPLSAGQYRLRLESGNGSVMQDDLEVVAALPALPAELLNAEGKTQLGVLWLSKQTGWALEAYQQALELQNDYPALGALTSLMTPLTPEDEKAFLELFGQ